jgi:hypothetical protein
VEVDSVVEDDSSHVEPGLEGNWVGQVDGWENLVFDSWDLGWAQHLPKLLQTEVNSIVVEVGSPVKSEGNEEDETHHQGSDEEYHDFLPFVSTVISSYNESGKPWHAEPSERQDNSEWSDVPIGPVFGVHGQQIVQNGSAVVVLDIGFLAWNLVAGMALAVVSDNLGIVESVGDGLTWWVDETDLEGSYIDHLPSNGVLELSLDDMVILFVPVSEEEEFGHFLIGDISTQKPMSIGLGEGGIFGSDIGGSNGRGEVHHHHKVEADSVIFSVVVAVQNGQVDEPVHKS